MMRFSFGLTALAVCIFVGCADKATDTSTQEGPSSEASAKAADGGGDSAEVKSAAGGGTGVAITAGTAEFSAENAMVGFKGSKPDGSSHVGGFNQFAGKATVDEATGTLKSIEVEIQTASIFSDREKLTGHLKNVDFFDVNEHPTATFSASQISAVDGKPGEFLVKGELTLLGTTQPVEFPATVKTADGKLSLEAQFKLDRTKFGMNYGEGEVNPDVDMTIAVGRSE